MCFSAIFLDFWGLLAIFFSTLGFGQRVEGPLFLPSLISTQFDLCIWARYLYSQITKRVTTFFIFSFWVCALMDFLDLWKTNVYLLYFCIPRKNDFWIWKNLFLALFKSRFLVFSGGSSSSFSFFLLKATILLMKGRYLVRGASIRSDPVYWRKEMGSWFGTDWSWLRYWKNCAEKEWLSEILQSTFWGQLKCRPPRQIHFHLFLCFRTLRVRVHLQLVFTIRLLSATLVFDLNLVNLHPALSLPIYVFLYIYMSLSHSGS